MDFSTILNLGSVALTLFGGARSKQIYDRQRSDYERQMAEQRKVGAFNAQVAQITGRENAYAVALSARRLMGEQRVKAASQGIDPTFGSACLLQGETANMGTRQAQEQMFNAAVAGWNSENSANQTIARLDTAREQAKFQSMATTVNMGMDILKIGRALSLGQQAGINTSFNIFDSNFRM